MFYVTFTPPNKMKGYLRGTIWTTEFDRRNQFASETEAQTALTKALKFLPKGQWKYTKIEEEGK